jgi:hypothetical protein
MRARGVTYFLIALLISAQVEDAWAVIPALPSSALPDDNDEYPLAARRQGPERPAPCQKPPLVDLKSRTTDHFSIRRSSLSGSHLAGPFSPSPLYVFMSLQC